MEGSNRQLNTTLALLPQWLSYEKDIVKDLYHADGLLIMGKGLGIHRIFACFIRMFCSNENLVLCLNVDDIDALYHELLITYSLDRKYLPKVIDAKRSLTDRLQCYKNGGCLIVTSRILVVDILAGRLDPRIITGLLIFDAHKVTETSIDAFITRLYREKNHDGFLKAFSSDTRALTTGFNALEQTLKLLFIKQVYLYPRYHDEIQQSLLSHEPIVYEHEISLTSLMSQIQEALLVALDAILQEIKRYTKNTIDQSELQLENALSKGFLPTLMIQVDPMWHQMPWKTKQLIGDLKTIKQFLNYLPRYDAISYYSFLMNHEAMNGQQRTPSPWLMSEAADRLFRAAKARIYTVNEKQDMNMAVDETEGSSTENGAHRIENKYELQFVLEGNPKWKALAEIISECQQEQKKRTNSMNCSARIPHGGSDILVIAKDERTCAHIREFLTLGETTMMGRRFEQLIKQKHTSLSRKGVNFSSMSVEQQLLMDIATKLKNRTSTVLNNPILEDVVDEKVTAELSIEKEDLSASKTAGHSKKRQRSDVSSINSHSSSSTTMADTSAFGLSNEDLEVLVDSNLKSAAKPLEDQTKVPKKQRHDSASDKINGGLAIQNDNENESTTKTANCWLGVINPLSQIALCSYSRARQSSNSIFTLLYQLMPSHVILYDPDLTFIRELEVFYATASNMYTNPLEVHIMAHANSVEQQTYLTEVHREKKQFEKLVFQKNHMALPSNMYDQPYQGDRETAKEEANASLTTNTIDTRTGGHLKQRTNEGNGDSSYPFGLIIVDVREFRSALPSMLHRAGMKINPLTIEVGDYILSSAICVERKSISDLFGSLNSGRLFQQAENMTKAYDIPVLLIEFTEGKAFSLQEERSIGTEVSPNSIISKLTLLILHFPKLRLLWSRSPHATVKLFQRIKKKQDQPDEARALSLTVGGGGNVKQNEGLASASGALEMLKKLPGVNEYNYRKILKKAKSLAHVSTLSLDELTSAMGKANGKKLYNFFNTVY